MATTITTIEQLTSILNAAVENKRKGTFVCFEGHTKVSLNAYPQGVSRSKANAHLRLSEDFTPMKNFTIRFHYGEDYVNAIARAQGVTKEDAESMVTKDSNRESIVPNILMRYKTTGNTCLIYLNGDYIKGTTTLNGEPLTSEQTEYMKRYMKSKTPSSNGVEFRNISVKNLTKLSLDGKVYEIKIA